MSTKLQRNTMSHTILTCQDLGAFLSQNDKILSFNRFLQPTYLEIQLQHGTGTGIYICKNPKKLKEDIHVLSQKQKVYSFNRGIFYLILNEDNTAVFVKILDAARTVDNKNVQILPVTDVVLSGEEIIISSPVANIKYTFNYKEK